MKIGFDATVLYGRKSGVGYYCEELLKALASIEHETEFFVFSHQPVRVELAGSNGNVRLSNSNFSRIRAFYLQALLPRILAREKPDLCHYTNFLAPVFDDTPYVVTIHDMTLERASAHPLRKRVYTRRLLPGVARRARFIITASEHSKWEIVRYLGIPADRIRVIPLAASPEYRRVPEPERRAVLAAYNLTGPYLLFVGNLEPRKNLPRLIEAFAGLADKSHELVIAGNPWHRAGDAVKAARFFRVSDRVRFLGYVPRSDLPALYSGATALAYPSLLEGFGLPVLEAMACGTPVITSNTTALRETAGDAALLVDPADVQSIRQALSDAIEDRALAGSLASRGLVRTREFSWETTAQRTLATYNDSLEAARRFPARHRVVQPTLASAIQRTIRYSAMFQYPLRIDELYERLFDVQADMAAIERTCTALGLPRIDEFVSLDPAFISTRKLRENISDCAIREVWTALQTLASLPFIRMIAFSGATAHRNMTNPQDVDLFIVVEDGKLWTAFLVAMVWAKIKGLRSRLCMNYVITTGGLPLYEHDAFTAQQAASLKPIFGKAVYDRFIEANSFLRTRFPNFDPGIHREMYREIQPSRRKTLLETLLRCGAVQIAEPLSRLILGKYLRRQAVKASRIGTVDVVFERRRLKLHMNSHKQHVLDAVSGLLAPAADQRQGQDFTIERDRPVADVVKIVP